MNFALNTIIIFLLLLPGIAFRMGFVSSRLSNKTFNKTDIPSSIVPALSIHFIAIVLIEFVINWDYCYQKIDLLEEILLTTQNKDSGFLSNNLKTIFIYNFILIFIGYWIGHLFRFGVRKARLDVKYDIFRFSNYWHYVLTGECLDFPHVKGNYEDIVFTKVDVLCTFEGKSLIYSGELFDYYLKKNGELESLHMRFPSRRDLENDDKDIEKWYRIPSKFLVIPFEKIENINIDYYTLDLGDNLDSEEEPI